VETLGHDQLIAKLLANLGEPKPYEAIYLHDLFKGLITKGISKQENRGEHDPETYKEIYAKYDRISSIAEESPNLIGVEEKKKRRFLYPLISPFNLKPETQCTDRFDDLPTQLTLPLLRRKYGSKVDEYYQKIEETVSSITPENIHENKELLKIVFDSICITPQRSWVSANDIVILAHLKGALLAKLLEEGFTILRLENPFNLGYKTLKDISGLNAVTRIFTHQLNQEIISENGLHILEKIIGCFKPPSAYEPPLIGLATPFTLLATEKTIITAIPRSQHSKTLDLIERALNKTLTSLLDQPHNTKTINITLRYSTHELSGRLQSPTQQTQTPKQANPQTPKLHEEEILAEQLNQILAEMVDDDQPNALSQVALNTPPTSGETCTVCTQNFALTQEFLSRYKERKVYDEGSSHPETLCPLCLARRLSVFHVQRTSRKLRGDVDPNPGEGWIKLFEPQGEAGKSLDELGDDIILFIFKLNLQSLNTEIDLKTAFDSELKKLISEHLGGEYLDYWLDALKKELKLSVGQQCGPLKPLRAEGIMKKFIGIIRSVEKDKDPSTLVNEYKEKVERLVHIKSPRDETKLEFMAHAIWYMDKVGCGPTDGSIKVRGSIDRSFTAMICFARMVEDFCVKLFTERIPNIILFLPSGFSTMGAVAVPKNVGVRALGLLGEFGSLDEWIQPLKRAGAIHIYVVGMKSYTPIELVAKIPLNPIENTPYTATIIPVNLRNGVLPNQHPVKLGYKDAQIAQVDRETVEALRKAGFNGVQPNLDKGYGENPRLKPILNARLQQPRTPRCYERIEQLAQENENIRRTALERILT
jgi:hypothetical protein